MRLKHLYVSTCKSVKKLHQVGIVQEVVVVAAIKSDAIQALTAAALALPGMLTTVEAAQLETAAKADFQYGHYEESGDRISVDIYQGTTEIPVSKAL